MVCSGFNYSFRFDIALNIDKVYFELSEPMNNEYVVQSTERGVGEYQPAVRQYLRDSDGAGVCVSALREM